MDVSFQLQVSIFLATMPWLEEAGIRLKELEPPLPPTTELRLDWKE